MIHDQLMPMLIDEAMAASHSGTSMPELPAIFEVSEIILKEGLWFLQEHVVAKIDECDDSPELLEGEQAKLGLCSQHLDGPDSSCVLCDMSGRIQNAEVDVKMLQRIDDWVWDMIECGDF